MASLKKNTYLRPSEIKEPPNFPSISKPEIVGYFSVNENRQYVPDASNCKYVVPIDPNRPVNFNLNHGFERAIHKDEALDEKIDHLLMFISNNMPKLVHLSNEKSAKLLAADVVCFRGLLRLLMCTPYENRDGWIILATKYRRTIYLCARKTDEERLKRMHETKRMRRIFSYGFKFEQYMMSGKYGEKPNVHEPVNEKEEFCCMFRSKLGGNAVLYGAEMDGIESSSEVNWATADMNSLHFIELKVKLKEEKEQQARNYLRFKLRNWWCQCFLVNIKKIIVGTRNNDGIVNKLSHLDVRNIPKQVQNYWSPSICVEFCNAFISMVKTEMANIDCPRTVCRFEYNPKSSEAIYMTTHKNDADLNFLPAWYLDILKRE